MILYDINAEFLIFFSIHEDFFLIEYTCLIYEANFSKNLYLGLQSLVFYLVVNRENGWKLLVLNESGVEVVENYILN